MALKRGPFIQATSRRDTNIVWYTDTVEDSVVKIGTTVGSYTLTFKNTTQVNTFLSVPRTGNDDYYKHVVRVTGLQPNTKYFYTIGNSSGILQGNSSNYFWTMVDRNDNSSTKRIWTIADTGQTGLNRARDAFSWFIGTNKIDAWIDVGDLVYQDGTWLDYTDEFFATNSGGNYFETESKKYSLFTVPGNHDHGQSSSNVASLNSPYFTIFDNPTLTECGGVASFTPQNRTTNRFYSFDIGDVHIITLDAYGISGTDIQNSGSGSSNFQYQWLLNDLKNVKGEIDNGNKKWIIVCCHHPPFNDGDHWLQSYGEQFRVNIVPLLHQYNVDLVIYGHDHNYQRTQLIHDYNGGGTVGNPTVSWNSSLYSYYPNSNGSGVGGNPIYNKVSYSGTVHVIQGNGGADSYSPSQHSTWGNLIISKFGNIPSSQPYTFGSGIIEIVPGGGVAGTDRLTYTMVRANTFTTFSIADTFIIDK